MNVLLLEDEEAIRGFVRINLKRNDMNVVEAENGEDALALAKTSGPFDIAIIDVMLPTIDGFEVCRRLREAYPRMGIIMLTAKSQEEDKIRGLELGADDYVQKPFSPGELIARMKSLYRRMHPAPEGASGRSEEEARSGADTANVGGGPTGHERKDGLPAVAVFASAAGAGSHGYEAAASAVPMQQPDCGSIIWGPFRLSVQERRLWKNGVEIVLTPTEWALVKLLMERGGESVGRDEILSKVWGRYFVGDLKIVDVNIRRIRQKLEDVPSEPVYIETIWGFGYRFNRSDSS
ncbi:response regulator transcription factor [Paenibacillus cisolokensis]|uniref:response regulator transcription factor n=1 Tax=Paenibacillus cisolokensis TaxID=1658519 RepID=UPI003D2D8177